MRIFKKIIIIFISLILVMIIGVGVIAYLGYDDTTLDTTYLKEKNKSTQEVLNDVLETSLEDSATSNDISLILTSEDIEYLVYSLLDGLNAQTKGIEFTSFKFSANDNTYLGQITITCSLYKSLISLKIGMEEENDIFKIKFYQVGAGKLSFSSKNQLLQMINVNELEKSLAKENIYCEIDKKNMTISFTKEHLMKMVEGFSLDNEENDLINLVISLLMDNSLVTFKLGETNKFGLIFHLNTLINQNKELPYTYAFDDIENDIELLASKDIVNITNINSVFDFLFKGYAYLDEEEKEDISTLSFSDIGIYNKESYEGEIQKSHKELKDYIEDIDFKSVLLNPNFSIRISESALTESLKNLSFVGKSYAFLHSNDQCTNALNMSYLCLEQFNIYAHQDQFNIELIINIHGMQIGINCSFTSPQQDGFKIVGEINDISFGTVLLNEEQIDLLFSYLTKQVTYDWFIIDQDNKMITLDFKKVLSLDASISENLFKTTIEENQIVISLK